MESNDTVINSKNVCSGILSQNPSDLKLLIVYCTHDPATKCSLFEETRAHSAIFYETTLW